MAKARTFGRPNRWEKGDASSSPAQRRVSPPNVRRDQGPVKSAEVRGAPASHPCPRLRRSQPPMPPALRPACVASGARGQARGSGRCLARLPVFRAPPIMKPQPFSVGVFFLPDRAGSRVLLGVPAEACGLHRSASQPVPGHIPLSPGPSSLRPRSLKPARSPQRPQVKPIQIKELCADESSGWIAASGAKEALRLRFVGSTEHYRHIATRKYVLGWWPR